VADQARVGAVQEAELVQAGDTGADLDDMMMQ
jgi:hypothetical protein